MSYTLDLGGNFPYADGSLVEDISIYLGNNKFMRILSQSNNDKVMAGIYQVDDVYNPTPTITTIHEQIIREGAAAYRVRLVKLGNGSVMVIHKSSSYAPNFYYFVIKYDETLGQFVLETDYYERFYVDGSSPLYNMLVNIGDNLTYVNASFRDAYNVIPYGQQSALVLSIDDNTSTFNIGFISNVYGTTDVEKDCTLILSGDTYMDNSYLPDYTNVKIIDDIAFITVSNDTAYSFISVDLINKTIHRGRSNTIGDVAKMDNDRYLYMQQVGTEVKYNLSSSNTYFGLADTRFSPNIYEYNGTNTDMQQRWTIPLDRFHVVHFRQSGVSEISAYVLKIMDENYAYVSPATENGTLFLNDNIFYISNGTYRDRRLSIMTDGSWIKQIDSTRFYIQTDKNVFKFFEMSATPST